MDLSRTPDQQGYSPGTQAKGSLRGPLLSTVCRFYCVPLRRAHRQLRSANGRTFASMLAASAADALPPAARAATPRRMAAMRNRL